MPYGIENVKGPLSEPYMFHFKCIGKDMVKWFHLENLKEIRDYISNFIKKEEK